MNWKIQVTAVLVVVLIALFAYRKFLLGSLQCSNAQKCVCEACPVCTKTESEAATEKLQSTTQKTDANEDVDTTTTTDTSSSSSSSSTAQNSDANDILLNSGDEI
jgi:hypothetical protein